jgi:hypothetical protein
MSSLPLEPDAQAGTHCFNFCKGSRRAQAFELANFEILADAARARTECAHQNFALLCPHLKLQATL